MVNVNFHTKKAQLYIGASLLVLGFLLGSFFEYSLNAVNQKELRSEFTQLRERAPEYRLINPLLACNAPETATANENLDLKNKLLRVVNQEKSEGNAKNISIYFRDLQSSTWIGIDEEQTYDPASMLKVVLMIAYVRSGESDQKLFAQSLIYTKEIAMQEEKFSYYGKSVLEVGKSYSVGELINLMITHSDNGAKGLLLAHVDQAMLNKVHIDLGLPTPAEMQDGYVISPKDYSIFFRILYNGTYLSRKYSNIALELLTRTTYKNGLVAGVPFDTTVAHKFGEYIQSDSSGNMLNAELHDCGIVYRPNSPYFLCVMTSGSSIETLQNVISRISESVYYTTSK